MSPKLKGWTSSCSVANQIPDHLIPTPAYDLIAMAFLLTP
jgi:hypothetical protein